MLEYNYSEVLNIRQACHDTCNTKDKLKQVLYQAQNKQKCTRHLLDISKWGL